MAWTSTGLNQHAKPADRETVGLCCPGSPIACGASGSPTVSSRLAEQGARSENWPSRARLLRRLGIGGVAAAALVLQAFAQRELSAVRQQLGESVELVYAPPRRFLEVVSLGYRNALANVLWFRTIDYFGRHYRSDRTYPWLAEMCDRVTDLDPHAEYVYRFGGLILPWEANEVDAGIALLEKGTRNLPDSWQLHYLLGFSYYFFRDDLERASAALRAAIRCPDAPPFLGGLLAVIEAAHRGPEQALQFLEQAYATAQIPEMREMLYQQILELRFARELGELQQLVRSYQERNGRFPSGWQELADLGWVAGTPIDPFGDPYVIDPNTGQVASRSGRQPRKLGSSQMREAILRGSSRPGNSNETGTRSTRAE